MPAGSLDVVQELGGRQFKSIVFFGFFLFASFGCLDWYRFARLSTPDSREPVLGGAAALLTSAGDGKKPSEKPEQMQEWSLPCLIALTSYRFYTGFLSATWLPYLLAMEGADLYAENQSLFMGLAKLIYGLTILTNPLFGLIGDRVVALSHGIGRRLFLRFGILIAGIGIFTCVLADMYRNLNCFVFGILLWRVGEALNDVTTEALVPELVPQSQYAVASAAKAASFCLGGVTAYIVLDFMVGYHYTWLYWSYAVGMMVFAIPCQMLLSDDSPLAGRTARTGPWSETLREAYIAPAYIEGWFPKLCLAIGTFSFGTSPMFFLLLMIRDLVGTLDPAQLQDNFSTSSMIFFLAAALATVVGGLSDKMQRANQSVGVGLTGTHSRWIKEPQILIARLHSVVKCGICYAIVATMIPVVCLFESHTMRISAFYVCALLLGLVFGSGFARFQDITWQLIPPDVDVANAMGFNIMCRLFGVGVGNFVAGLLLDFFMYENGSIPPRWQAWYHHVFIPSDQAQAAPVYAPNGYVVMCLFCAAICLSSSRLCYCIAVGVERDLAETPRAAA
jgi:hypothetical protein